ncbi:hypothetical protein [Oerskovia flava]|uniref:hypothetical protein n=1 Tax=Oerskovia flava TaxID=2986422 RepID=UPI00223F85E5|nr:hypothetical protein [Oerskovia sp. JB1-3-2]
MSRTTQPSTRPPTVWRRALAAAAGLLGASALALGLATPSAAHGGDVVISLGTDGQGGISANLTYKNDGHPVEEAAELTVTAESADGERVGPVVLMSASEGVGWYVSQEPVLDEGNWTLTATMTAPVEATSTAQVDVVAPEPAPDPADEAAADDTAMDAGSDPADGDAAGAADDATGGAGSGAVWWAVLGIAAVAAVVSAVVVTRRRSGSTTSTTAR